MVTGSDAEQAAVQLRRGGLLGKYKLKKRIDVGGSGQVWQARDQVEGIWVALKIPLVGTDGRPDNEAVLREIHSVSQLRHPNILSVKNADIIEGHAVLATELSTGTLSDCSMPMSVRRIISIMSQVLAGLAYAHSHRTVHCDVTPGNIFLFPDGRAALGDFGISLKLKGRARTIDDYGTPGYVAPEQAYGRPTYRSDCFSVGLILYEYITGTGPRWPFAWPLRGCERLRQRTGPAFVKFVKKSLAVDPERRFANAAAMRKAMIESLPRTQRKLLGLRPERKESDWRLVRREAFVSRYRKVFWVLFRCVECDEPIEESMVLCPWCGSGRNRFDTRSRFDFICTRCHKGVLPEWRYCPWCYGPGFACPSPTRSRGVSYHARCKNCDGKVMRFMRYCPWCRRKIHRPWEVHPFPEVCTRCGWSVDTTFWSYCPWCRGNLIG